MQNSLAAGDVKVERIDPNDPFSGSDRNTEGRPTVTKVSDNPNTTFSQATLIGLNTSFTGKDLLRTSILVGNGQSPANNFVSAGLYNTTGVPVTDKETKSHDYKPNNYHFRLPNPKSHL